LGNVVSPYLTELFDRLACLGDPVLLMSRPRHSEAGFEHEQIAIPKRLKHILAPRFGLASWRAAFDFEPDIVVVLGHTQALALALAACLRTMRLVRTVYMGDTNGFHLEIQLAHDARARALLYAKRMVLGSTFDISFDLGRSNVLANRLMGIRAGLPIPLYSVDFKALDHRDPAPPELRESRWPRLLCIARLVPQKNLPALVKAWSRWVALEGDGCLFIAGEGPERRTLEGLASHLSPDRLRFLGAVPRHAMGGLLSGIDGLVLPSTHEPWGIVVVEALGLGVPVLATTRVGAAASLAPDHPSAVTLCAPDEMSLSLALEGFMQRLANREDLGGATQIAIRDQYGMDEVAGRLHRLGNSWTNADPKIPFQT
jgi:glycosyltransferase involved in cell wall biosynthesis